MPDHSRLQRHVNLAVAYNVWHYFEVTDDIEFLANYGAELLVEIARLFSSLAVFNSDRGRYEIRGVIGPDEYHDEYPGASRPGIDNNAYTNVMVVWLLRRAADALAVRCSMGIIATRWSRRSRWTSLRITVDSYSRNFRSKPNSDFRDEPEHHRSLAALATRLCKKCSASSRKNCPKRSGGREPEREKGRGERTARPVPTSAHSDPERDQRSG